jgi:hypothetical protein
MECLREMGFEGGGWIRLAQDRVRWGGSCEHGILSFRFRRIGRFAEQTTSYRLSKDDATSSCIVVVTFCGYCFVLLNFQPQEPDVIKKLD